MKFYSKQIHSSTSRHAQPPAPARDETTPTPIYHIPRVDRLSFFRPPYFARWAQYVRLCRPISPVGLNTCACVALFRPLGSIRALGSGYCPLGNTPTRPGYVLTALRAYALPWRARGASRKRGIASLM